MLSFRRVNEELALIDLELASLEIPKFHGQNDKLMGWFSKVEQVFACYNFDDQEKFKVVVSKLRDCALQWWNNYKFKRRKKGKEKVRTWKKLRNKLMVAFCPPTYMLKHVPLLSKKNDSKASCNGVHSNKRSPKRSCTFSLPTKLPLKGLESYEDVEVNEKEGGLNQFDLPPIFDDYGDEETHTEECNEVNCDLPPKCDEYEEHEKEATEEENKDEETEGSLVEEPKGDLHEEFEPPLPQKECLHSQQELRTILFEERGNDVYFQGDHVHSVNATSWEESSIQNQASKALRRLPKAPRTVFDPGKGQL